MLLQRVAAAAPRLVRRASAAAGDVPKVLLEPTKQPPSRIRAVFFGFLTGVTFSCGVGYVYLTEDINESAVQLQRRVEALRSEVAQLSGAIGDVEALKHDFEALRKEAAKSRDFDQLKKQVTAERDELTVSLSEHKAKVWEAQEEIFRVIEHLKKKTGEQ